MSKGVFDVELLGPFGLLLFQIWSSFKCQGFTKWKSDQKAAPAGG